MAIKDLNGENILMLTLSDWELVREHFTEMEKDMLNGSNAGESICPRAIFIDLDKAGNAGVKVKQLVDRLSKDRSRILR